MSELLDSILGFLSELKRRKVYRVAAVYVIVAAGALELVDLIVPSTRLPAWSNELFLALAVLGFPLAVVLAWAFDVTPAGVRATLSSSRPGGAGDAGGAENAAVEGDARSAARAELDTRAVAVLPFENLSGTADAEPFAAGLHDDLLTELSRIEGLTVISRTSMMRYREGGRSIPEIARDLGAGTVVEGGVQQSGERVRLNVQLIDARRDVHRWAERYDRELTAHDIFDIQSDLATRIASTLQVQLTSEERGGGPPPTDDLDAYRRYSRARVDLAERTEEGLTRALAGFQAATSMDPVFGPAWGGLAMALVMLEFYGFDVPDDAPDPRSAAERAVRVSPDLGETHAALGIVRAVWHEGPPAVRALERAVELSPSDSEAHAWLGWMYLTLGRPDEAVGRGQRAAELDPRAPAARAYLAEILLASGREREASDEARRARELQPSYALAHYVEGLVHHHRGRTAEAVAAFEEALSLTELRGTPSRSEVRAALAVSRAADGDEAGARELLGAISTADDPFSAGLVHAALGEVDRAFDAFDRLRDWGSFETEHARYFFPDILGSLRDDARYPKVLAAVNRSWGLEPDGRFPETAVGTTT